MLSITPETIDRQELLERLVRYVRIDTASSAASETCPSTPGQIDLARQLATELQELGVADAAVDGNGYVYGHIAGDDRARPVALLAHLDVSPDVLAAGVTPLVHRGYDGGPIRLPAGPVIDPAAVPGLAECRGGTIITSDGSTLLGADDKAGIAIIMTVAARLLRGDTPAHPPVTICFTPDEEIGRGVDRIDLARLGASLAYTIDGGLPWEINAETFNAVSATVTFDGINHHPGEAQGRMVNAVRAAAAFVERMPIGIGPEMTAGRQPYIHPQRIEGSVERATVGLLLRGFEQIDIDTQRQLIERTACETAAAEPRLRVAVDFRESYRNMAEPIGRSPESTAAIHRAAARLGVGLVERPIRGGTDGARLSFLGVPTPNIFTGGSRFHSLTEWVSLEGMACSTALVLATLRELA